MTIRKWLLEHLQIWGTRVGRLSLDTWTIRDGATGNRERLQLARAEVQAHECIALRAEVTM